MQHQASLSTDHRLMRLAITLLALVAGLQEGGTQPSAGAAGSSSGSGSAGSRSRGECSSSSTGWSRSRGECSSSSTGSRSRGECSNSSHSSAKDSNAPATPAAAAAGSAVAANSLTPAAELSQQLWQQLGLPLCSWGGFVEAWGLVQPQFRSILQAVLQSSGDGSGSSGSSSSGVAAGRVVRPDAVQGALVAQLAQSLNYGYYYA